LPSENTANNRIGVGATEKFDVERRLSQSSGDGIVCISKGEAAEAGKEDNSDVSSGGFVGMGFDRSMEMLGVRRGFLRHLGGGWNELSCNLSAIPLSEKRDKISRK
jgi:hypothetical protein